MPDNAVRKIDTTLSDRDVLLHILEHVEHFTDVLEEFRPMLNLLKGPDGKVDMIGAAQLRRRLKRG
jgi:hypothetical protein